MTEGRAFGQGAGLVHDERVDLLHPLQRFGVLDEDTHLRSASDADHDGDRCGEPQRTGAGDDEDRDRDDEGVREPRVGADERPHDERDDGDGDDGRNEHGRDPVSRPLDGGTGALRFGDHGHDAGQHGVPADLLGAHDQRPGLVDGAADDRVAGGLGDRHRLTGDQRLIERGTALLDLPVDRHLLARADPQPVADLHLIEGDFLVGAVGADPAGRLRGQVEQRLDGTRGLFAGA